MKNAIIILKNSETIFKITCLLCVLFRNILIALKYKKVQTTPISGLISVNEEF